MAFSKRARTLIKQLDTPLGGENRPGQMFFFTEWRMIAGLLPGNDFKKFFLDCLDYGQYGVVPDDMNEQQKLLFQMMQPKIDDDRVGYYGQIWSGIYGADKKKGCGVSFEDWLEGQLQGLPKTEEPTKTVYSPPAEREEITDADLMRFTEEKRKEARLSATYTLAEGMDFLGREQALKGP